jgi:hypothetical protein
MSIINLNLTDFMCSADRLPGVKAYAETVDEAVQAGRYEGPLTTHCPECGTAFYSLDKAYADDEHIIILTTSDTPAVIVGCEGYFVVNPNEVGIPSPNWQS